nr:hypothetical protein [Bradyrhizobium sp.]
MGGFGVAAQNMARKKRLFGLAQSLDAHQIFGDFNWPIVVFPYQGEIFLQWPKASSHVVRQDKLL